MADPQTPLAEHLAALTAVSQRSVTYYRDMAQACRRSAAIERNPASHLDPEQRHAARAKADGTTSPGSGRDGSGLVLPGGVGHGPGHAGTGDPPSSRPRRRGSRGGRRRSGDA